MVKSNKTSSLSDALKSMCLQGLSSRDRDFLYRVFAPGLGFYISKLEQLEFSGMSDVLDAGCGFGQWSFALSRLNDRVIAMDLCPERVKLASQVSARLTDVNVELLNAAIEYIPLPDNSLDAVFSFSVIYNTDYLRTLSEFSRVLRPGGKLYICSNGIGWYVWNLINNHNPSEDFSPRREGACTIFSTIYHELTGKFIAGYPVAMSPGKTIDYLVELGFDEASILTTRNDRGGNSHCTATATGIYPETFLGLSRVFEILARRG